MFPDRRAGGGVEAQRPLLAVELRRGERAAVDLGHRRLAFAHLHPPQLLRPILRPGAQQPLGVVDVVVVQRHQPRQVGVLGLDGDHRRGRGDDDGLHAQLQRFEGRLHEHFHRAHQSCPLPRGTAAEACIAADGLCRRQPPGRWSKVLRGTRSRP